MKVILLERVGRTGQIGDEVNVKDGFARNFLLPQQQGAARHRSQPQAVRRRARRHRKAQHRAPRSRCRHRRRASTARPSSIIRQAGETGQLYGSVASRDIAEALAADGFTVGRSQVDLANPIKTVGMHTRGAQPPRRSRGDGQRQRRPLRGRSRAPGQGRGSHRPLLRPGRRGRDRRRPGTRTTSPPTTQRPSRTARWQRDGAPARR